MENQLSLFKEKVLTKTILGLEYAKKKLLSPKSSKHIFIRINDATCEGYELNKNNSIYFDTEEERNAYLNELNEIRGVDENGNNNFGYFKTGNHIKDNIWDYGITKLEKKFNF